MIDHKKPFNVPKEALYSAASYNKLWMVKRKSCHLSLQQRFTLIMAKEEQKDPIQLKSMDMLQQGKSKRIGHCQNKVQGCKKIYTSVSQTDIKRSVLYYLYIYNDVYYHQLTFPVKYQAQMLQKLNNGKSHQGISYTTPRVGSASTGMQRNTVSLLES